MAIYRVNLGPEEATVVRDLQSGKDIVTVTVLGISGVSRRRECDVQISTPQGNSRQLYLRYDDRVPEELHPGVKLQVDRSRYKGRMRNHPGGKVRLNYLYDSDQYSLHF